MRRVPIVDEREARRFLAMAHDLLAIADLEGRFLYANQEWERQLGWSAEEVTGRPFLDFVHPDDQARTRAEAERMAAGGAPSRFTNRFRTKEGGYRWLEWTSRTREGSIYAVARDVTDRRQAEEARLALLRNLAHDLVGPLQPLRLQVAMLRMDHPGSGTEIMRRSVEHLVRLVEDIQDVLRLQTGNLRLRPTRFDLAASARAAAETYEVACPALRVEDDGPLPVIADEHRMTRVVVNLVRNACKFTPPGGRIIVRCRRARGEARISVEDTGRGLDPEEQARLFRPFSQVHDAREVKERGTGLGLYICKGIVEQHGGRIWVESAGRGRGSAFHVALPLRPT